MLLNHNDASRISQEGIITVLYMQRGENMRCQCIYNYIQLKVPFGLQLHGNLYNL